MIKPRKQSHLRGPALGQRMNRGGRTRPVRANEANPGDASEVRAESSHEATMVWTRYAQCRLDAFGRR